MTKSNSSEAQGCHHRKSVMLFHQDIKPTLTIGGFFIGLSCVFVSLFSDLVRFLPAILNKAFSEREKSFKAFPIVTNCKQEIAQLYVWQLQLRCSDPSAM